MYYNWKEKTNTEELNIVCNLIRNGELVIFPTETVYGIGANALDPLAVGKIFLAKGRQSDNPLIVHLADKRKINEVVQDVTPVEQKLIDAFMPGPFTLILRRKKCIPDVVTAGLETVGIRIPDNIIAKAIITYSGCPIAAPSANISGKPSGTNINDIRKELEGKVSAIVDGGDTDIGLESTVVKVVDEIPVILRPGRITPEDIDEVCGNVKIDRNIFNKVIPGQAVESPGMKYRHYAPETKCKLVNFSNDLDQLFYLKKYIKEYNADVVVIGFEEHKEELYLPEGRFLCLGKKHDLESVAKNVYSMLRKADEIKPQIILIEGVEKRGLGIAIMNRLIRTCEYDYIEG